MAVAQDYDALLLDLDGTIWEGGRAIPGAVVGVIASGLPAMYVTNNASRAPEAVAASVYWSACEEFRCVDIGPGCD